MGKLTVLDGFEGANHRAGLLKKAKDLPGTIKRNKSSEAVIKQESTQDVSKTLSNLSLVKPSASGTSLKSGNSTGLSLPSLDTRSALQQQRDTEYYQDLRERIAGLESAGQAPDFASTVTRARVGEGSRDVPLGWKNKRLNSAVTYLAAEEAGRRGDERYGGFDPQQVTSVLDNTYKFGQMTDGEKNTFLYYIGRKEYDKADDYLDALQRTLNARASGKFEQAATKLAQDAPALGVLANVGTWPLNIPALFANAGQAVKNAVTGEYEPTDTNSDAFLGTKLQRGTGTGVQEAARSRFGDAGAFLAGTGLSMGQNLAQMPLGPVGALAGMSASAAGSSTLDALERGASPGEALALGRISGGLEAITEKLPLDQLFRIAKEGGRQTAKQAAVNFIKQMGTEATEEAISEVAGNIADTAMLGGRSEYQRYVEELKAQGLSEQEARQKAFQQFYLINTGLAAAGGALSGGVMGAGAQVIGNLNYRGNVQQGIGGLSPRERTEIVNQGLKCDPKSRAYKLAVQAVNKSAAGGEVSDGELAKIFLEVERQIEREKPGRLELPAPDDQEALAGEPERLGLPEPEHDNERVKGADWDKLDGYTPELSEMDEDRRREYLEEREKYRPNWGELDELMAGAETENLNGGLRNEEQGERVPDGGQGREPGAGAGEQIGELAAGPDRTAALAQQRRTAVDRQSRLKHLRSEKVSSLDLGLSRGTAEASVSVIQEVDWDDELRSTVERVRKETGLNVTFVMGRIPVQDSEGEIHNVRGVYSANGIILQADSLGVSADQIADHEIFHSKAFQTPGLVRDVELHIKEKYGEEEFAQVVERYTQRLHGMVDVTENSTPEEIDAAMRTIREEILADAYAGINAFAAHAERYQGDVEQVLEEQGVGRGREFAAATARTNGPPNEMFSIEYARFVP